MLFSASIEYGGRVQSDYDKLRDIHLVWYGESNIQKEVSWTLVTCRRFQAIKTNAESTT
jgi:hypothetical protein